MEMLVDRQSGRVVYMPRARKLKQVRVQALAAEKEEEEAEADAPAIRYENDYKVGGGDLEVPVSMVDYDNLGEGSIVDQRYPRKLPGLDELEAQWNGLFSWGSSSSQQQPGEEEEEAEAANAPAAATRVMNKADLNNENKLEGLGVNT
mmetsp:Transcript_40094/g.126052  ORF Transcript_40094/g.126052 Transcript_40094/m.126052 type:complete len:148 (+) Transcript_40094:261-704(+)